ncbi:carbohydrate deacetylase [Candidatus Omnitrophota bacterium]
MKKLIINADDVGLSSAINEGIVECLAKGSVTGVSIISCGKRFQEACALLRDAGKLEVGVHLTLTGRFAPYTRTGSTILEEGGVFPQSYFNFMARYYQGGVRPEHVYLELANQIHKVTEEGLRITHIDSHEHVHMFPKVLGVVLALAKESGVPYIRIPLESSFVMKKSFSVKDLLRYAGLRAYALRAQKTITEADIKYNDGFLGHFHSGRLNDDIMSFIIDNLPEGINELAVHPAVESPELMNESPWHKNAAAEMDMLLNGSWREKAREEGIELISHAQVV